MTASAGTAGLTERIGRLAVEWQHPDRGEAWTMAERAMVDTVGVTLAARLDPTVRAMAAGLDGDVRGGSSTVWATGAATDSRTAALLNGTCAHALDFDDVDDQMIGHPSAVLVPAVLCVGEDVGASGGHVLDAYWVGLAVSRSLAAALDIDRHYGAGWHSTGTIGAVAAAAAAARLQGLTLEATRHALGIAGSLASGSRQNFGTMTKPLHAGVAASNGILAARLAGSGYTADPEQLERPLGYLALHDAAAGERHVTPELMAEPRLNVKLHACCYYIHAAADAMLELSAAGLTADAVRRITVTGPADGFAALIHHRPVTGLQGKFSMEYAMAACLLDGALPLTTFTDEAVNRPEARRLVELVNLQASTTPPIGPAEWTWTYAVVTVDTEDGTVQTRVDKPRGHATRPLAEAELRGKFDDCLTYGGLQPVDELYEALRGLRALDDVRLATHHIAAVSRTAAGDPAAGPRREGGD